MKTILTGLVGVGLLATFSFSAIATPSDSAPAPAVNVQPTVTIGTSEVLKLVQAGISTDIVAAYIAKNYHPYQLSADTIIYLRDQGVSPQLITDMIQRDAQLQSALARQESTAQATAPAQPVSTTVATTQPTVVSTAPAVTYVSSPPTYVDVVSPTYYYPTYYPSTCYSWPSVSIGFGFPVFRGGFHGSFHDHGFGHGGFGGHFGGGFAHSGFSGRGGWRR